MAKDERPTCPRCYSKSVFVGSEIMMCLLCNWSKRRANGAAK